MRKKLTIALAIVAILCLMCTFVACNDTNGLSEVNRENVSSDFVSLALIRVNSEYKSEMTVEEIKALEEPQEYIVTKNMAIFVANILSSTSIRVQKLARLNDLIWAESPTPLFANTEEDQSFSDVQDAFMLLNEVGWTSEDIAEVLYAFIDHAFNSSLAVLGVTIEELSAFKANIVEEDYESNQDYLVAINAFDSEIKDAQDLESLIAGLTAPENNVLEIVAESKDSFTTIFEALARTFLMMNSDPMFSIFDGIDEAQETVAIPNFTFNITATELSAYVGGIKTSFDDIMNSFSKEEMTNVTNSLITINKLLRSVNCCVFDMSYVSDIFSAFAIVMDMSNYAGEFISRGLGSMDTNFMQQFIDFNEGDYPLENSAILVAKTIKAAIGDNTATSIKAMLDEYKQNMGTDMYTRRMKMYGLAVVGDSVFSAQVDSTYKYLTEADANKIIAASVLDHKYARFVSDYYDYEQLLQDAEDEEDIGFKAEDIDTDIAQILVRINELTGETPDLSAYTLYSEEWFNKVKELCNSTIDGVVDSSIDIMIAGLKVAIDEFFAEDMPKINEIAEMPFQTYDGENTARLYVLDDELELSRIYLRLFSGIFYKNIN